MTGVWRVAALSVLVCALYSTLPSIADAHPLGNFTVNHYSRVEMSGDTLAVRYVVDFAEIPSVQETRAADTNGDESAAVAQVRSDLAPAAVTSPPAPGAKPSPSPS